MKTYGHFVYGETFFFFNYENSFDSNFLQFSDFSLSKIIYVLRKPQIIVKGVYPFYIYNKSKCMCVSYRYTSS